MYCDCARCGVEDADGLLDRLRSPRSNAQRNASQQRITTRRTQERTRRHQRNMDLDASPTPQPSRASSSHSSTDPRTAMQHMHNISTMASMTIVTQPAASASSSNSNSASPPLLLLSGQGQESMFSPVASVAMMVQEEEAWMPGLQFAAPTEAASATASPPLLHRPASDPPFSGGCSSHLAQHHLMQLTSSTSPSLFDIGGAAGACSSASTPASAAHHHLAPMETAIVHSFLAFSPSPPTTSAPQPAPPATQADESMSHQQAETTQQSQTQTQAHQQQPLQQPPPAHVPPSQPPQQPSHTPSVPAPFLIPLFSPSPALDGHMLALRPTLFDLHTDAFSPAHHLQTQTQSSSDALASLDGGSPAADVVPRDSYAHGAPFVAAPSPASSSPSPRLHHPRPLQHSPLQRYAAELEVAELFYSRQNQISEQLALEIETMQRRKQIREGIVPHMQLDPPAATYATPLQSRTAHIVAHQAAVVATHTGAHQPIQQHYAPQRPVLASLATPVERAIRVDAHHPQQHHSHSSTSLPRNRRVMAPMSDVPHHHAAVLAQQILSPPSSTPTFRLSTSSAAPVASAAPHRAAPQSAMPHVPLATRAAPMARVTPRSMAPLAPSMQCTRAAAAAAASSSHAAAPADSSLDQGATRAEGMRPSDSGGSNSVASFGSVAVRPSLFRALSPVGREFLSPPVLPSLASASSAARASATSAVGGSESLGLIMTRKPRAAAGSKRKCCDWPGCTSSFAKLSALIRHRRVHTKEKPFVCERDGCTAAFSEKGNLVRHEEEMHADHRNFACPFSNYCAQRFRRAAHLEQHLAARHAALGEDISKPWLFHAPPEEQPQLVSVKRKWRAPAAAAAAAAAASSGSAPAVAPSWLPPAAAAAAAAASASAASSQSDRASLPSVMRDAPSSSTSSSREFRFVINSAAVEAAAAAAAAGSSHTTNAATMPLQRLRVQPLVATKSKAETSATDAASSASASASPAAASVPASSKRRLSALSPPQPLMSDSSSSSESSLPLHAAMDAMHLPPAAVDNTTTRPRSPRPKRTRKSAATTPEPLSLAQLQGKSSSKPS